MLQLLTGFAGPDEQSCAGLSPHDKRKKNCCQFLIVGGSRYCLESPDQKTRGFMVQIALPR
jgi:hypothetical protein